MTIISNSHRFIFVHLHKCGGSSVEVAYQPHARWNDLVLGSTQEGEKLQMIYQKLYKLHKHNPAADLKDKVPEVWNDYWKFSLIRHPKSIYESFYKWIHKTISSYSKSQGMPMNEVKRRIASDDITAPFMHYEVTKPFANAEDFNDYIRRFLKKSTLGTLFERLSQDGNLIVDDVYKLEQIDRMWAALSARMQVNISPAHANKGSALENFAWSSESIRLVNDTHAMDYETFHYEPAKPG